MKSVSLEEIKGVFKKAMNGEQLVHVVYLREMPKCMVCGKRFKKENLPMDGKCCGKELSFVTEDTCRFGVQNPGVGITKPGTGEKHGISAREAFESNYVKYYSFTRVGDRDDGRKGGYRQFKLENLVEAKVDGERYLVNIKVK